MFRDARPILLDHVVGEWRRLQPVGNASPPRGVWLLAHEPIPSDTRDHIATAVTDAWYGNAEGVHERDVARVLRLRAHSAAWSGRPYHRWGWVDIAPLVDEPVYYMEVVWGGLDGYGVQAAVTRRGLVLTSAHLWRA